MEQTYFHWSRCCDQQSIERLHRSTIVPFATTSSASTCTQGVAAMGIYVDDALSYVSNGAELNTSFP